jgi:hypothetical protein
LNGTGRPLVNDMHARAIELLALSNESSRIEECRAIAERLQRTLPAEEVLRLIDGISDNSTRTLFHAERLSLNDRLAYCLEPAPRSPSQSTGPDFAVVVGLVDERLDQLGIDR